MRGESEGTVDVQFKTEVPLPSLIRKRLLQTAEKFLERHHHRFGSALLQMHVKRAGPQLDCVANLVTDDGRYNAHAAEWDIRKAADTVFDTLDTQVIKRFDRRMTVHA